MTIGMRLGSLVEGVYDVTLICLLILTIHTY